MDRFSEVFERKLERYRRRIAAEDAVLDDLATASLQTANAVVVCLSKGKISLIDAEDAPRIRLYSWFAKMDQYGHWYAYRAYREDGKRKQQSMHRFLMNAEPGDIVDHKSGDSLDNRRSVNLRICTNKQNVRNARLYSNKKTSQLRGVSFIKSNGRFRAQIMCSGVKINLGNFTDEQNAAIAYDDAAHKLFGEFARLNFPERFKAAA